MAIKDVAREKERRGEEEKGESYRKRKGRKRVEGKTKRKYV